MWVLESYISKPLQAAYPSLNTIAKQSGLSRSTVKRALKDLHDSNIVRWQQSPRGDQMVNHYFFCPKLECLGGRFTMNLLWVQREPTLGSKEGTG